MIRKSLVVLTALAMIAGAAPLANAADTTFNTDLVLNDSGGRTSITMEGAEVIRVDGGGIFFGDVGAANLPFTIRVNGGNKLSVNQTDTTLSTNLHVDTAGSSRSKIFMETHEIIRVNKNSALLIGDIANVGLGVVFRTSGTDRLTIAPTGEATFSKQVTVQILEITGGSDLSEQFDIALPQSLDAVQPGMVVSIDPVQPGKLVVSSSPYERTVAGIVSGAGGLNTGMIMGQKDSEADGQYPVALSGRVYCFVDASFGAVQPGDLLTTSATTGHAMKVTDPLQAMGAVIGKAMTPLAAGQKGLVLVLVSLQ